MFQKETSVKKRNTIIPFFGAFGRACKHIRHITGFPRSIMRLIMSDSAHYLEPSTPYANCVDEHSKADQRIVSQHGLTDNEKLGRACG